MLIQKNIKVGERFEYVDSKGLKNSILIDDFSAHDHKKYPVYYLDYPLSEEDIAAEKDNVFATFIGFGFSEPYCGDLKGGWKLMGKDGSTRLEIEQIGESLFSLSFDQF